jgi:sulfatase modifying factor 1
MLILNRFARPLFINLNNHRMRNQLFTLLLALAGIFNLHAQQKNIKFGSSQKDPIQLKNIESWFAYIPSQSIDIEENKILSMKGFLMMRFETPNMLYRLFIEDLKATGKIKEAEAAFPDTNIWFSGMAPYKQYYFQHPAYNKYPVLGISKEKINMFCNWLNEKIKTVMPKSWDGKKVSFRLPTENEWMVAALGGNSRSEYAWDGNVLQKVWYNTKAQDHKLQGRYMANFCQIDDAQITRDANGDMMVVENVRKQVAGSLMDEVSFTAPVLHYWPNNYGLYNMCGNVREFVQENGFTKGGSWMDPGADLRIRSRNTFKKEGFPCEGFRLVAEVE